MSYVLGMLGNWFHMRCLRKAWTSNWHKGSLRGMDRATVCMEYYKKPEGFVCCVCGTEEYK